MERDIEGDMVRYQLSPPQTTTLIRKHMVLHSYGITAVDICLASVLVHPAGLVHQAIHPSPILTIGIRLMAAVTAKAPQQA